MAATSNIPNWHTELDGLLETADIDVVLATSKHNVQHLLDGYRYPFFENFDALGVSRYLPMVIYPRGRPEDAVYLANAQEDSEIENGRVWCRTTEARFWGSTDVAAAAVEHIDRLGMRSGKIGVELGFIPADAIDLLRGELPQARFKEALLPLERLRAVKTPKQLEIIRKVSDSVVDSMIATFAQAKSGMSKQDIVDVLKREETARGLRFDWCYIGAGSSFNRAPSPYVIKAGDVVTLDSGGSMEGYFGDLCRMGVVGEPDKELRGLLDFVDGVQMLAREPIKSGVPGRSIYDRVDPTLSASPLAAHVSFVAHGMGIIGHEAPRISDRGSVTYPAFDYERPLEAGMVLSIETTMLHPSRGVIKLEDTVVVTDDGVEGFGDHGRGWNLIAA